MRNIVLNFFIWTMRLVKGVLIFLGLCLVWYEASAQTIELQENKVSQMIFEGNIQSFRGGFVPSDIIIDKENNMLYIQCIGDFPETNLNVICEDGRYYKFILAYNNSCTDFNHIISKDQCFYKKPGVKTDPVKEEKKELTGIISKIMAEQGFIQTRNAIRAKKFWLILKGIYVAGDKMYFRIMVNNESNIKYDLDCMTFSIAPAKKKKNQIKENVQLEYKFHNKKDCIKSGEKHEFICEIDKFTINSEKRLFIDMIEAGGERNLSLQVDNETILQARKIN